MKTIGVCLWSLVPMTLNDKKSDYEVFKAVKDMGVDYIDFIEDYVPCHPHIDLAAAAVLRKTVRELGLKVGQTWFYADLLGGALVSSPQAMVEQMKDYLYIAAEIEARFMCISTIVDRPGMTMEQGYAPYRDILAGALPTAEKLDIPITLEYGRPGLPAMALKLAKEVNSPYLTLTPDFEGWRLATDDVPLVHVEAQGVEAQPEPLELFYEALPYSRNVHAKLLGIDENGTDPHFPIEEMMGAVRDSKYDHHLCVEYEGWIPDINPQIDCVEQTKKCVELMKKYI